MFNKKNIFKFESALEEYPDILVPAKSKIPGWYKKIPKWKDNQIVGPDNNFQPTIKNCMPFLDTLSSGYLMLLPYDLYVKNVDDKPFIVWKPTINFPPSWRSEVQHENLVPHGYYPLEYTWYPCVSFKVPKGFDVLFTHPLNRYDLPFITLSGILEGGWAFNPHGNIPFYIKRGFEGIIEQGTPIAQIIPFRKERWFSEKTPGLISEGNLNQKRTMSNITGWYKNNIWSKKEYN